MPGGGGTPGDPNDKPGQLVFQGSKALEQGKDAVQLWKSKGFETEVVVVIAVYEE